MKNSRSAKIKLFLVCSGLDRVNRGYESFTRECFEALAGEDELDVWLWKGGGTSKGREKRLWNWPRDSQTARFLGEITGRGAYFIEQLSFALSFLPRVSRLKPQVIYFSDGNLGNLLWHWRRLTRGKYRLLFSNGGPLSPPFPRWDHVQQVAPSHLETALSAGENPTKHTLVPYGIRLPSQAPMNLSAERDAMRDRLGLPVQREIILCVAALNKTHKRMDYLIREVAALPLPRPFLLMLGQQEEETPELIQLANELLADEYEIRTVTAQEIGDFYRVVDCFVLASLNEGFGRVFLEAMSYSLSCLAHDYPLTHYVLEEHGYFADFKEKGALTSLLKTVLANPENEKQRNARQRSIRQRFGWDAVRKDYVSMVRRCNDL